jgi:hypothetical protein
LNYRPIGTIISPDWRLPNLTSPHETKVRSWKIRKPTFNKNGYCIWAVFSRSSTACSWRLQTSLNAKSQYKGSHVPTDAQAFLFMSTRLARSTFRTISYLCADIRQTQHDWNWETTLVLPALNRTILDSVFSIVFMLEDPANRSRWYHESGFREAKEELERYKNQYAALPEWEEWLKGYEQIVNDGIMQFGVSPEALDLKRKYKWWPNPGSMPREASPKTREFLRYLSDWFYREMSSQVHLSLLGTVKFGSLIAPELFDKERQETISFPRFRALQLGRTVTLLLCLVSEIEYYFSFGMNHRVLELWQVVIENIPETAEIFRKRYTEFWPYQLVSGSVDQPTLTHPGTIPTAKP